MMDMLDGWGSNRQMPVDSSTTITLLWLLPFSNAPSSIRSKFLLGNQFPFKGGRFM